MLGSLHPQLVLDQEREHPQEDPFERGVDRRGPGGELRLEDRDHGQDEAADQRGRQEDHLGVARADRGPGPDRGRRQDGEEQERLADRPLHGHRRAGAGPVDLLVAFERLVREGRIAGSQCHSSGSREQRENPVPSSLVFWPTDPTLTRSPPAPGSEGPVEGPSSRLQRDGFARVGVTARSRGGPAGLKGVGSPRPRSGRSPRRGRGRGACVGCWRWRRTGPGSLVALPSA